MARSIYVLTLCSAALLAATSANALQLTNRDTADHAIVITENGADQNVVVKPSEVLDGFCLSGCTIKTSDGEEYEFEGTEVVSIEDGVMYLDSAGDTGDADLGETLDTMDSAVEVDGAIPN